MLTATTVHQELRVLRRMLNVAVRKNFFFANPCAGVEFPARVNGLFRPQYITWSEQQRIEFGAGVPAQRDLHHHGDRTPGLQRARADEKGAIGPGKRGGVDSRLEDPKRGSGSSADGNVG